MFPLLIGSLFKNKSICFTYLAGQMAMWAAFQLAAVPAVHLRVPFTLLFWIYTAIVLAAAAAGLKTRLKVKFDKPEISVWLVLAVLVIAYQCGTYIFGMHVDQDDARWIAEANDALERNRMLLDNPSTGEYIGRFVGDMVKDMFSPWAFYIAWLSGITGIQAAVMAHTVYAPILLIISYMAFYELGKQLFPQKTGRGVFLLAVSVINLFMGGNVYTQSVFILVRIWQGKAVVAAVMIPAILMLVQKIQKDDQISDWVLLITAGCACCLFSGMGIAIGLIMIAVYGFYTVACRRWKRIPFCILSVIPSLLFGLGYYLLK